MRVQDQSRLIVAAGGGGTAGGHATSDGQGGDAKQPGGAGDRSPYDPIWTTGANPGSQAAGGAPGWGLGAGGDAGSLGLGGAGGGLEGSYAGGGGGGGGWYGGGGGGASSYQVPVGGGGGAGGANHVDGRAVESFSVRKATTGRPSVVVTWLDDVAPVVSIETPANGLTPILHGNAGTELGDEPKVQVAILAAGKVVQQLTVAPDASGRWSAQPSPLAPGTYTADVLQYDRVRNLGARKTATFTVSPTPGATPKPTPTAQPAEPVAEPVYTSTQPVPPAAQAPAAIRIETARAHLRRGVVSLRVTCAGAAGQRCGGRVTLTARRGKRTITVGSAPYAVLAGRRATVRVRIGATPRLRRVIARAGAVARPIALAP